MNIEQRMQANKRIFGEFGGVNPSIHPSTTFTTLKVETMQKMFKGELNEAGCYLYGRHFHPNSLQTGMLMAAIENTEIAYPVSSGMAAIQNTIRQVFQTTINDKISYDGHLVSSSEVYGGTFAFFKNLLPALGVNIDYVNQNQTQEILNQVRPETKAIYLEMHSNPSLKGADIQSIKNQLNSKNLNPLIVIDNTFSPLTYTPKELGADIIIHSGTKFLNGMSDFVSGVICCSHDFLQSLMDLHHGELMLSGAVLDPISSHRLFQCLHTLPIRIKEHSQRAEDLAVTLENLGKFRVIYPGLQSHEDSNIINRQFNTNFGYGGILAVDLETQNNAEKFVEESQKKGLALHAVSLGYYDTLMSISKSSTSSEIDEETLNQNNLSEGLVRISMGITGDIDSQLSEYTKILSQI